MKHSKGWATCGEEPLQINKVGWGQQFSDIRLPLLMGKGLRYGWQRTKIDNITPRKDVFLPKSFKMLKIFFLVSNVGEKP